MDKRNSLFDSIRGIAIIGIFMCHVVGNTGVFSGIVQKVFTNGLWGVEVTYIISAFFYIRSYKKYIRVNNAKFIALKIFRLLPFYYIVLGINIILRCRYEKDFQLNIIELVAHLLFVNSVNVKWFSSLWGGQDI